MKLLSITEVYTKYVQVYTAAIAY